MVKDEVAERRADTTRARANNEKIKRAERVFYLALLARAVSSNQSRTLTLGPRTSQSCCHRTSLSFERSQVSHLEEELFSLASVSLVVDQGAVFGTKDTGCL